MAKVFIYDEVINAYQTPKGNFVIEFDDELSIHIRLSDIEEISIEERPELIAILMATIKACYQTTKGYCSTAEKIQVLKNNEIVEALKNLVEGEFDTEDLIEMFRQFKWYHICQIINDTNPTEGLKEVRQKY